MNKVFLIGNISTDIELKQLKNGCSVATFNIAISREKTQQTDFLPVIVWNQLADNVNQYQSKGGKIAIEGKIQTRDYEDKEGKKHTVTEIVADRIEYLSKKETKDKDKPYRDFGQQFEYKKQQLDLTDDEIPF